MSARLVIDAEAEHFVQEVLRMAGRSGHEAAVLLAGPENVDQFVDRIVIPRQQAHRSPFGCGLTIDGASITRIAPRIMAEGRRIHGLLHSHPDRAYHSPVDDASVMMRVHDAYSLVVPRFGASDRLLHGAALYRFDYDFGWVAQDLATAATVSDLGGFEVVLDD